MSMIVISRSSLLHWMKVSSFSLIRLKSDLAKDALQLDTAMVLTKPEELEQKKKLGRKIKVAAKIDISPLNGMPEEHLKSRKVRIHIPPKNVMQSGTDNIHHWQIEFDNRQRWENPLVGWTSSGDPLSNLLIKFNSKEEAVNFCEKNGLKWFIDDSARSGEKQRVKNYGINFSFNKRTRVSTK